MGKKVRSFFDEFREESIDILAKYNISKTSIAKMKELGINTIEELLIYSTEELKKLLDYEVNKNQITYHVNDFKTLRTILFNMGLIFRDDFLKYTSLELDMDILLLPIESISPLSWKIKNLLKAKYNILCLGDLLTLGYEETMNLPLIKKSQRTKKKLQKAILRQNINFEPSILSTEYKNEVQNSSETPDKDFDEQVKLMGKIMKLIQKQEEFIEEMNELIQKEKELDDEINAKLVKLEQMTKKENGKSFGK